MYDDDPYIRMSYPDLVEDGGQYYLTETQKDIARVHEVDPGLLEGLWGQFTDAQAAAGAVLGLPQTGRPMPQAVAIPPLPAFLERDPDRADYGTRDLRRGFSIVLWVRFDALHAGQVVLDSRTWGRFSPLPARRERERRTAHRAEPQR